MLVEQVDDVKRCLFRETPVCTWQGCISSLMLSWVSKKEEEMAIHSSILAWRIPWTEEPGRLQSIGLQRVRHG